MIRVKLVAISTPSLPGGRFSFPVTARVQAFTQDSCNLPSIFIDFSPCRVYTGDGSTFIANSTNATKATLAEI
jgi:hypothetical protein